MTPQEEYDARLEQDRAEFRKCSRIAQRIAFLHSAMGWGGGPIFDGLEDDEEKGKRDFKTYQTKYGEYRSKRNFSAAAQQAFAETVDIIIQEETTAHANRSH